MTVPVADATMSRTVFDVRGMDCAECARSVATAVERLPGVSSASVNFGAGTLTVEAQANSQIDLTPRVLHAVEVAGYRASTRGAEETQASFSVLADRRSQLAIAALGFWIAGGVLSVVFGRSEAARILYAIAVAAGAWAFGRAALQAARSRRIDMNVLMTLAIAGAVLLGDWAEAAAAAALFAIGNLAQSLTFDRTRNALSSLSRLAPSEALRVVDGREELVAVERLSVGDTIRVKPGERFAIDGVILEGSTSVDESLITGESLPSDKHAGAWVFAGSLNGSGSVLVQVTHTASDSTLAAIVELVEEARGGRGYAEQTIDRFASIYTPVVVGAALLVTIVGAAVTGDLRDWATRGLVLLVIACPCALIISTPVAIVSAVGVAAKRGFLVKGGAALETIATVRAVVFDKTGTLTRGRPTVSSVVAATLDEEELIRLAAAVEAMSEHPLGVAVVDYAAQRGIAIPSATGFQAVAGRGARASVEGRPIWIGSPTWFDELDIAYPGSAIAEAVQGRTVLLVATEAVGERRFLGRFVLADQVRSESAAVVERLHQQGIKPVAMMTGDNQSTAESIAKQCGVDVVFAGLLPNEKATQIVKLREQAGAVAMVGDGVNDGPALGSASVGFAMGLTGSDLAVETADVAILRNDLFAVPGAIDLSRRTVAIIRQNIGISLLVKVVALALTLVGVTTLWMAVAVDLGTSLLVTANALRLTRWQLDGAGHRHGTQPQASVEFSANEASGLAAGDA